MNIASEFFLSKILVPYESSWCSIACFLNRGYVATIMHSRNSVCCNQRTWKGTKCDHLKTSDIQKCIKHRLLVYISECPVLHKSCVCQNEQNSRTKCPNDQTTAVIELISPSFFRSSLPFTHSVVIDSFVIWSRRINQHQPENDFLVMSKDDYFIALVVPRFMPVKWEGVKAPVFSSTLMSETKSLFFKCFNISFQLPFYVLRVPEYL